jgi:phosphatidylinositol alpha 1,6-mannosyltransferase
MRVAIVTESFLPQVNGVANSVRHVTEQLVRLGHHLLIIAPGPGPSHYHGVPVTRVRSVGLPGYRAFPLGLPDAALERALSDFGPDVVHLASPIVVGAAGLRAARRLGVPTVAVYQTDIAGFSRQYGVRAEVLLDRWVGRLHRKADRTLVPSRYSHRQLADLGVTDLHLWRRGVSLDLFDPTRRDPERHARLSHEGREVLVGYVGRLAPEKQVRRLAEISDIPGSRLVVVGEGPERSWLGRHLPGAHFAGQLGGTHLATAFASLDVFVHPGTSETFCQTVQEAQASGVPVVAAAAGGPLDLVEHGRTGLLFDPEDQFSLWRTVTALVRDPELRSRLASQAREQVQGRTWPIVVEDLVERHYRAVIEQRRLAIA